MDHRLYDPTAAKRPTNLSLNQDLVAKVRAMGGSLSERVERLLARDLESEAMRRAALAASIEDSNALMESHGLVGDEFNDGRFA